MSKSEPLEGFKHYKTCRCGGSLQHRYENIDYPSNKYWIYPTKGQVRKISPIQINRQPGFILALNADSLRFIQMHK